MTIDVLTIRTANVISDIAEETFMKQQRAVCINFSHTGFQDVANELDVAIKFEKSKSYFVLSGVRVFFANKEFAMEEGLAFYNLQPAPLSQQTVDKCKQTRQDNRYASFLILVGLVINPVSMYFGYYRDPDSYNLVNGLFSLMFFISAFAIVAMVAGNIYRVRQINDIMNDRIIECHYIPSKKESMKNHPSYTA